MVWVLAVGAAARAQEPQQTSVCQISRDPAAYDHKLVQVTAFASHGFEDFTLLDPECEAKLGIWLEYGGTTSSGTTYCCNVSTSRKRSKPIQIEGLEIPLIDDKPFRDFDRLIQRGFASWIHATLVGRFFAGVNPTAPNSVPGFGHMGCCSLLMIQQVLAVDGQTRIDVDYGTASDLPAATRNGCGIKIVLEGATSARIAAQRQAEAGPRAWAFEEPVRVASDALVGLLNLAPETAISMTQTRKSPGRLVFEWRPGGKKEVYTVVVNRPYWLSFYAKDPQKVAWVVMAGYEFSCQ